MAQGIDKGLDAPMPERGMLDQTQAAWCPSCGLGPVGLNRDLVDNLGVCSQGLRRNSEVKVSGPLRYGYWS